MTQRENRYLRELPVRIGNKLIQKSQVDLSAAQFDMLMHIVSVVRPTDVPGTIYSISIPEYFAMKGSDKRNGQNYIDFKENIEIIDRQRFWFKIDGKRTRLQWFHILRIEEGSGTIEVSFNDDVVPYLYNLTGEYTEAMKLNGMALSSKYSKKLYLYLKSIQALGGITITVEDFCEMACPNNYKEFKNIKRWVLDVAQEEINDITDIVFLYKPIKRKSRKTTHIQFIVAPKPEKQERERREHAHAILDNRENKEKA